MKKTIITLLILSVALLALGMWPIGLIGLVATGALFVYYAINKGGQSG